MSEDVKINRGLKGVFFERSGVSDIDGKAGTLSYRGYSIDELASNSTFEEVSYLLIHGELPTSDQLAAFDSNLRDARSLPGPIYDVITSCQSGHPMDVLRTAVSALAAIDEDSRDVSEDGFLRNGHRLMADTPPIGFGCSKERNPQMTRHVSLTLI